MVKVCESRTLLAWLIRLVVLFPLAMAMTIWRFNCAASTTLEVLAGAGAGTGSALKMGNDGLVPKGFGVADAGGVAAARALAAEDFVVIEPDDDGDDAPSGGAGGTVEGADIGEDAGNDEGTDEGESEGAIRGREGSDEDLVSGVSTDPDLGV